MTPRESVDVILESLHAITDSYGTPADRPKVTAYINDPTGADFQTYLYVGRIPLSNFYAHADQAFDKGSLWQEVQDRSKIKDLPQPPRWDASSLVSVLALWVDANGED